MRLSRIVVLAATVATLAASPPASAQYFGRNKITYGDFDWKVYASPHFDVHHYWDDERLLQQLVSEAESAYLEVSRQLDHEIRFRIPLILYRTHADFEQTNITLQELPEGVGAFAEPFQNRMVVPIDEPPDRRYALIKHELTHIFEYDILYGGSLRRALRGNAPLWLMEGLASYIADDEDTFDQMVIRDAVVNNMVPSVRQLDVLSYLTYRFGHAIFAFIEDEYGPEGVRTFLFESRKQLVGGNMEKAFSDAFGLDVDQFDRIYARWLRQRYLPVLTSKRAPEDYGREIGLTKPGEFTLSPALSPSGDLIAALATPKFELDAVILAAKDGERVRNLTKGFTTKYESIVAGAFEGKRDLDWMPDGDHVGFFVRRENDRPLVIFDVTNGRMVKMIRNKVLTNENSPAFSPDGRRVAFSANREGVWDIFIYDLESGELVNATQDEYYDANPSWSADGKSLLYNRRIGAFAKIFAVEVGAPERKTQLTAGAASDIQPVYSRDGKTVYFSSDRGEYGVFNIHRLDLATGTIERLTDLVGGAFAPLELMPGPNQVPQLAFTAFSGGTFRLYRMPITGPEVERAIEIGRQEPQTSPRATSRRKEKAREQRDASPEPAADSPLRPPSSSPPPPASSPPAPPSPPAHGGWPGRGVGSADSPPAAGPLLVAPAQAEGESDDDIVPFAPPLELTLDPDKRQPYRAKWDVDVPDLFVGVTDDGTFLTNFAINFSDLLGDQRVAVRVATVSSYSNIDVVYLNLGSRWDWSLRAFDYRDYYVASTGFQTEQLNRRQRYTAVEGNASYPFNRYFRFETGLGFAQRRYDEPVFNPNTGGTDFIEYSDDFPYLSAGLVYDSVRYQYFGPYQGKQVRFRVLGTTFTGGDNEGESVVQFLLDSRMFQRLTDRSLIAWRLIGLVQSGSAGTLYAIGGVNDLRGFEFREFFGTSYVLSNLELRFPLLDSMRLPFGVNLAPVRGFFFVDFGTAWFGDQEYVAFDDEGNFTGIERGRAAYDNFLGTFRKYQPTVDGRWLDYHGSVGAGFTIPVLGLPLTWTYAKVYDGEEFGETQGSFYIVLNW